MADKSKKGLAAKKKPTQDDVAEMFGWEKCPIVMTRLDAFIVEAESCKVNG